MKRWVLIAIASGLMAIPIYIWSKTLVHSFPEDATLNIYIGVYIYDLGRFLAVVGFVLIFIQFALSSKIKLIESGIGLDKLINLHRIFGVIGLIFIVIHPVALYSGNILQVYGVQDLGSYFKGTLLANIFLKTVGFVSLIILCVSAGIAILYKYVRMKYETWKKVHMTLYGALPMAFIHSSRLGSDVIRSIPLKIYWWILLGLFFVISIHRIWMWFSIRKNPFTITGIVQETYDTWSLYFKGKNNGYKPGQFLIIRLLRKGKLSEAHPFTISSSPTSPALSISVKSVGDFTSTIGKTTTSDFAYIDLPYGVFSFLNYDARFLVFISGGIGVTPFISMLRYLRDKKLDRKVILIWGNKTWADTPFRDELEKIDQEMPSLSIVHVMSNQADWEGEKGYIDAEKIRRYINDFDSSQFFICGPIGPWLENCMYGKQQ
jgi:predicted ferric reductase